MTKNHDVLERLINKFDALSDNQLYEMNEQTTRQEYIDVFLKELGWDVTNSESLPYSERPVIVEEFVNKTDRPDYTLRKFGQTKFFVEAKRPSVDILSHVDSVYQAKKYGWNAKHNIVVLTNFKDLLIFQTYMEPDKTDAITKYRFKHYNFKNFIEKFDEIYELLSKESIENGYYDEWTSNITPESATIYTLDNIFLQKINNWRIKLGQDLYNSNIVKFRDKENLNIYVQKILNQLVFLRFAEDNQLENSNYLQSLLREGVNTKLFLKKLDEKYNSELFDEDTITFVGKSTLSEIILDLYYPNSSFDFSVIPLEILSKMYENYLQTELNIIDSSIVLEPTTNKKIKSVVSTPDEIAKFMVKEALRDKLKGKNNNEILELKIFDIATGSGIFLIESYNLIESYLIDYYSKQLNKEPSPMIVPFSDKVKIITNMFFGVDINILATQLTRFSLVLRILRNESRQQRETHPILPSLKNNILLANTLVSDKDLDITKLSVDNIKDIAPQRNDLPVEFDVIVGNPPYLKTEDIKNSTTPKEIAIYKSKYLSSYQQYDKYFLFIERAIQLSLDSKRNTKTVLIVPNKFINSNSGKELRKYIKKHRALNKIINFRYTQLFEDVTIYVCILSLELERDTFDYIEASNLEDIHIKEPIEYETSLLTEEGWFLIDNKDFRNRYEVAMKKFPMITEEVIVSNGIQTSKNSVYIIDENEIIKETSTLLYFKKNDVEYTIEKGILRNYYKKSDYKSVGKSYRNLESESYVIFPYENGISYEIEVMEKLYPLTWKYLNLFKEELSNRKMSGGNPKHWYRFGRNQHLKELDMDKLIVGVMSKEPNFNIDRNNYLFSSGGTAGHIAIMQKEDSLYSLEYLQAWLSHSFTDTIFKVIGSDFEGDFYTHGTYLYTAIPLLPIDFENNTEKAYYNQINEYVRNIESINQRIKDEINERNSTVLFTQKEEYIKRINELIDKLLIKKVDEQD